MIADDIPLSIKGLLKIIAFFIAFCVVLLILGVIAVFGPLSCSMHKLVRYSQRVYVGMSIREFVKIMPTDYHYADVFRARRDVPCRGSKGEFVPPESDDPASTTSTRKASKAELAKLAPCPAVTDAYFEQPNQEGMISLQVQSFEKRKLVTAGEFAEFLESEFRDSGFYIQFVFDTDTPQYQSFGVFFDRSGRVSEIVKPWAFD